MSCITEQTIVLLKENEQSFLDDCKEKEFEHCISNVVKVHEAEGYVIYVFDCNGDGPWYMGDSNTEYEALEIYYGTFDGEEEFISEIRGEDGMGGSAMPMTEMLEYILMDVPVELIENIKHNI